MDLFSLAHQCAPTVPADIIVAIMRTESRLNPLALHLNARLRLRSLPETAEQAAKWSDWLIHRGYSVDLAVPHGRRLRELLSQFDGPLRRVDEDLASSGYSGVGRKK